MNSSFKLICYIAILLLLSSCSSYRYSTTKREQNNTFTIKTNVSNFNISNAKYDYSHFNGFEGSYTLQKLNRRYLKLEISKPDYETKIIRIRRTPRIGAIIKDIVFGVILYETPIVIDVFRPDFYKVSRKSKHINLEMRFTDEYLTNRYDEIKNSTNPKDFEKYIQEYPYSKLASTAKDQRDLLMLNSIIEDEDLQGLIDFKRQFPDSKYLATADSAIKIVGDVFKDYEKVMKLGVIDEYINFINFNGNSKYAKDVAVVLVNIVEQSAVNSGNIDSLINYHNNFLKKYSDLLGANFAHKSDDFFNDVVNVMISKHPFPTIKSSEYDTYVYYYKTYQQISNGCSLSIGFTQLPFKKFKIDVSTKSFKKSMLHQLWESNSNSEYDSLVTKFYNDFSGSFFGGNKDVVADILKDGGNSPNFETEFTKKNKKIVLYNVPLNSVLNDNDVSKIIENIHQKFTEVDISFSQRDSKTVINCINDVENTKIDITWALPDGVELVRYFSNNELVLEHYFSRNCNYDFHYKDGVNITEQQVVNDINKIIILLNANFGGFENIANYDFFGFYKSLPPEEQVKENILKSKFEELQTNSIAVSKLKALTQKYPFIHCLSETSIVRKKVQELENKAIANFNSAREVLLNDFQKKFNKEQDENARIQQKEYANMSRGIQRLVKRMMTQSSNDNKEYERKNAERKRLHNQGLKKCMECTHIIPI